MKKKRSRQNMSHQNETSVQKKERQARYLEEDKEQHRHLLVPHYYYSLLLVKKNPQKYDKSDLPTKVTEDICFRSGKYSRESFPTEENLTRNGR